MRRIKRVWKFEFYQNIQLVNDKDLQNVDEMSWAAGGHSKTNKGSINWHNTVWCNPDFLSFMQLQNYSYVDFFI